MDFKPFELYDDELQGLNPFGFCIPDTEFRRMDCKVIQRLFMSLCRPYGIPERIGSEFVSIERYIIMKSWLAFFNARGIPVVFVFGTRALPVYTFDGNAVSAFEIRVIPQNREDLTDMQKEAIPVVICNATNFVADNVYISKVNHMPFIESLDKLNTDNFNYSIKVPKLKVIL